jgi:signal transduction histidine kinase
MVTLTAEPGRVRFSVRDPGPGIATEQLGRIFDRYWQARPASRKGSGLGLFISKRLVEAHHGEIWVESTLGRGSEFHFTLAPAAPP